MPMCLPTVDVSPGVGLLHLLVLSALQDAPTVQACTTRGWHPHRYTPIGKAGGGYPERIATLEIQYR